MAGVGGFGGGGKSNAGLIDQLERKENLFSQLGQYISQVQEETGSVNVWREKLKELDETREKADRAGKELKAAHRREQQLIEESEALRRAQAAAQSDVAQLNQAVIAERQAGTQRGEEIDRWKRTVDALRTEVAALREEVSKVPVLRSATQELNEELSRLRSTQQAERDEMNRSLSSAKSQLAAVQVEKNEVSRHFWNMTEDLKTLKDKLDKATREAEGREAAIAEHVRRQSEFNKGRAELEAEQQAAIERARAEALAQSETLIAKLRLDEETAREELVAAQQQRDGAVAEQEELRSRAAKSEERLADAEGEADRASTALREARAANDRAALDAVRLGEEVQAHQAEVLRREEEAAQLRADSVRDQAALAELRRSVEGMRAQEDRHAQIAAQAVSERDAVAAELARRAERHQAALADLQQSETAHAARSQELLGQVELMNAEVRALRVQKTEGERGAQQQLDGANSMVETLQEELDKRLSELHEAKDETSRLREERGDWDRERARGEAELQEREKAYAAAYTKEKERLQHEFRQQRSRTLVLESEKKEMLCEQQDLNKEVISAKRDTQDALDQLRRSEKSHSEAVRRLDEARAQKMEILEELKHNTKREEDKANEVLGNAQRDRDNIDRLTAELKSAKRSAAQQVVDFQTQSEMLLSQLGSVQAELKTAQDALREKEAEIAHSAPMVAELKNLVESEKAQGAMQKSAMEREIDRVQGQLAAKVEGNRNLKEDVAASKELCQKINAELREMRESKRSSEVRAREAERAGTVVADDLKRAKTDLQRYQLNNVQLEEELSRHKERAEDERLAMESKYRHELESLDMFKGQVEDLREKLTFKTEAADEAAAAAESTRHKLDQLTTTTNATINGLMAELKATEEALTAERDRIGHEADVWRDQVRELEQEMDTQNSKYKGNISSLRDDADDQRKVVYALQSESSKAKLTLDTKRRENERLVTEIESAKDMLREAQRGLEKQKEIVRSTNRELEAVRNARDKTIADARYAEEESKRESLRAEDALAAKERESVSLKQKIAWAEREHSNTLSLMEREKEDLLAELGIRRQDAKHVVDRARSIAVDAAPSSINVREGGFSGALVGGGGDADGDESQPPEAAGNVFVERDDEEPPGAMAASLASLRTKSKHRLHHHEVQELGYTGNSQPMHGDTPLDGELDAEVQVHLAARAAAGMGGVDTFDEEDEMAEKPNWPPQGGLGGRSSQADAAGRAGHVGSSMGSNGARLGQQHADAAPWQSTLNGQEFAQIDTSGTFISMGESGDKAAGQAIQTTADFLNERRNRARVRAVEEQDERDSARMNQAAAVLGVTPSLQPPAPGMPMVGLVEGDLKALMQAGEGGNDTANLRHSQSESGLDPAQPAADPESGTDWVPQRRKPRGSGKTGPSPYGSAGGGQEKNRRRRGREKRAADQSRQPVKFPDINP